jgi:hypothetical protein
VYCADLGRERFTLTCDRAKWALCHVFRLYPPRPIAFSASKVTGTDESRMNLGRNVDEMNQTRRNSTRIHPEFIAISFIGGAARPQSPII